MSLVHHDCNGASPAVISRSALRLMALVHIISLQVALALGLGIWLAVERHVPAVAARVCLAFGVGVSAGTVVFWRLGVKWGRRR